MNYQRTVKSKLRLVVTMLLCLGMVASCADRTRPAPVVNLSSTSTVPAKSVNTINSTSYKVRKGETLYSIAWRAGTDVRSIARLNNLTPPYNIYPGQQLTLKGKVSITKTSSSTTVKKVVNTSQNEQKNGHKDVANQKSQEYGGNKGGNFTVVKVPSLTSKVKAWNWPVNGKVISRFSSAAQGNKGIDIAGKMGTPIKSAADGLVVYAGNALRGYGNLIIIKHNDDYLSAYAHNDELLIKEQQKVKANQVIAKMGNSGTNKTMLHFEIRFRGKSVDPMRYLPKK